MRKLILLLSLTLYGIGHVISIMLRCKFLVWLYPLYSFLMQASLKLDKDEVIWKDSWNK